MVKKDDVPAETGEIGSGTQRMRRSDLNVSVRVRVDIPPERVITSLGPAVLCCCCHALGRAVQLVVPSREKELQRKLLVELILLF